MMDFPLPRLITRGYSFQRPILINRVVPQALRCQHFTLWSFHIPKCSQQVPTAAARSLSRSPIHAFHAGVHEAVAANLSASPDSAVGHLWDSLDVLRAFVRHNQLEPTLINHGTNIGYPWHPWNPWFSSVCCCLLSIWIFLTKFHQ